MEELEIRRPIWIALSELYLDTEPDWARVAGICARSPFAIPGLPRILFDEVHPVVHRNLWSTVGVWDGLVGQYVDDGGGLDCVILDRD